MKLWDAMTCAFAGGSLVAGLLCPYWMTSIAYWLLAIALFILGIIPSKKQKGTLQ